MVAPLVGAWIEISPPLLIIKTIVVAPLVGAWIEINYPCVRWSDHTSLLSWERGLKLRIGLIKVGLLGRSSRGSVD